jgi:hypothetical protein
VVITEFGESVQMASLALSRELVSLRSMAMVGQQHKRR